MGSKRLRAGLYVMTAAALLAGGVVAPMQATAALPMPNQLAPNDPNSAPTSSLPGTPRKNVVLSWGQVADTPSYQVQVSDHNGMFDNPAINATTNVTSFAPSSTLPRGDYAWRVRATGGTWSNKAYFTRGWTAAPGNPHQVDGAVLTWDGLPDASYYEVQLSPLPFYPDDDSEDAGYGGGGENKIQTCMTASTVFSPYKAKVGKDQGIRGGLTTTCTELQGQFYWRVRARDGAFDPATTNVTMPAAGCTGVWYFASAPKTEQADECSAWAYPDDPTIFVPLDRGADSLTAPTGVDISPRAGANVSPVIVSSTPVFDWNAVPEADFYRLYQSRTPRLDTHDHLWETQSTTLAPVLQEPDRDVRYYWAVQACADNTPEPEPVEPEPGEEPVEPPPNWLLDYADDDEVFCGPVSPWQSYVKTTPKTVQPVGSVAATGGRTFTWTTAADLAKPNGSLAVAVGDVMGYELQISSKTGSFDPPARTVRVDRQQNAIGMTSASLAKNQLPDGYSWRVRGVDSSGNRFPWSSTANVGSLASPTAKITTGNGFAAKAPIDVQFSAPVKGVSASTLRIRATSNNAAKGGTVASTGGNRYRFTPSSPWHAGERYTLSLSTSVTAATSNIPAVVVSKSIRAYTTVDSSSVALTKKSGDFSWAKKRASDAMGKTYLQSNDKKKTAKRSYVQTTVRGTSVRVYACTGRSSGKAGIYVNGKRVKTVNLYRGYSSCGKVATVSLSGGKAQTVRFAPLGTKSKKSKATTVRFDGFRVS